MYYKLTVFAADKKVYNAIVELNQTLDNGVCNLTKIAEEFVPHHGPLVYKRCEPKKLFVSGTYILEEYPNDLIK